MEGNAVPSQRYSRLPWQEAVLLALFRFRSSHTNQKPISRQSLIEEELDQIKRDTQTKSRNPEQLLSFYLQGLRDSHVVRFVDHPRGHYVLLQPSVDVERLPLTDTSVDFLLSQNVLRFGRDQGSNIPTDSIDARARRRRGQERLRLGVLQRYGQTCAVCDVTDKDLLVASHIVRWSDDVENRGNFANAICLCRFHDALFEIGYLSFTDDLQPLKKPSGSATVKRVLDQVAQFRVPLRNPPDSKFLKLHRLRSGIDA